MQRIYELQKSQYKLDQDKIKTPEFLVEQLYQQMQAYQTADVAPTNEIDPIDESQEISPSANSVVVIIVSFFTIIIASSLYFLITSNLNREVGQVYEDGACQREYCNESSAEEFTGNEPKLEPEESLDLEQEIILPIENEEDGRFQIIIRPSLVE